MIVADIVMLTFLIGKMGSRSRHGQHLDIAQDEPPVSKTPTSISSSRGIPALLIAAPFSGLKRCLGLELQCNKCLKLRGSVLKCWRGP